MNILIVGSAENYKEASNRLTSHTLHQVEGLSSVDEDLFFKIEVVFDFISYETPESISFYEQKPDLIIFLNIVLTSFGEMMLYSGAIANKLFGFNGLPTFFDRPILECSVPQVADKEALQKVVNELNWQAEIVDDRVAMATPRIICMIINEAYYTVQEGTASRADIDQGMKLGTNYPYGPFEWAHKIGIENVYEVLNSIYEDTKEERYKICPLLKKEYLQALH